MPDSSTALATTSGHTLDVEALTVRYGRFTALDAVTLAVEGGEILALLGPSGCGKTTLLRSVAGFTRQAAGSIRIDGASVDQLPPERRRVGIVFQNYALFPHMTVFENIAYGMRARREASARVTKRVHELLELVQLGAFAERRPTQLSGGQQQRVALARALAIEPRILLLDEPFAALDRSLRLDLQIEIKRLQRQLGLTAILVTHDQDEAMSVADRIAVMRGGRIEQLGSPVELYDTPRTLFVAGFIGTMNRLPCRIDSIAGGQAEVTLGAGARLRMPATPGLAPGASGIVVLRPEQLVLHDTAAADRFAVEQTLAVPIGGAAIREMRAADGTLLRLIGPRSGAIQPIVGTAWCGLAANARPTLFATTEDQP